MNNQNNDDNLLQNYSDIESLTITILPELIVSPIIGLIFLPLVIVIDCILVPLQFSIVSIGKIQIRIGRRKIKRNEKEIRKLNKYLTKYKQTHTKKIENYLTCLVKEKGISKMILE